MKIINLILLGFLFFCISIQAKGQNSLYLNEEASYENLRKDVDNGVDFNQENLFDMAFGRWWFACDDEHDAELWENMKYCIKNSTKDIEEPFWEFSDPCRERRKDILIYFECLYRAEQNVSEKDFLKLIDVFYLDEYEMYSSSEEFTEEELKNFINYQDAEGKTALMYACEYDYVKAVKKIMKKKPDLSLKDKDGKTVKDYYNGNKKILNLLK